MHISLDTQLERNNQLSKLHSDVASFPGMCNVFIVCNALKSKVERSGQLFMQMPLVLCFINVYHSVNNCP